MALLTYEYRLYPRKREMTLLEQMLAQGREVYNAALQQCRNVYEATGQHVSGLDQRDLAFMTRNPFLALSAHDAALGAFKQVLTYKAEKAGCQVVFVNAAYTSQECSQCGARVEKALSVRVHDCPHCGLKIDRDLNAAVNIKNKALESARTEPSGANVDPLPQGKVMRSLRSPRL